MQNMVDNPLVMAYMGDTIYEQYIREYLIRCGLSEIGELQQKSLDYVSAKSQRKHLERLENCNFLFARKDDTVRQPLGLKLYSHYFDIETFNSRIEEFCEILKVADSCGFKGHNAKNLILRIYLTQRHGFSNKVRKKIDMFVNLHPLFFKTISRRIKKDTMIYSVDKDYQQFGQNGDSNRSPVLFGDNEIGFQMFRSTTNINTILATIELCYLVVDFCDT